jgi:hypothetical protein
MMSSSLGAGQPSARANDHVLGFPKNHYAPGMWEHMKVVAQMYSSAMKRVAHDGNVEHKFRTKTRFAIPSSRAAVERESPKHVKCNSQRVQAADTAWKWLRWRQAAKSASQCPRDSVILLEGCMTFASVARDDGSRAKNPGLEIIQKGLGLEGAFKL